MVTPLMACLTFSFFRCRHPLSATRRITLAVMAPALLAVTPLMAQDDTPPKVEPKQLSYFLGMSYGQQLSQNGFKSEDFEDAAFMSGLRDGLSQEEPSLSEEELQNVSTAIQALLQQRMKEMQAESLKAGQGFLAEKAKEDGIAELPGGVLYKVVEEGDGESPSASDTVQVHYTGRLINGNVFDSSIQRGEPATFRVNQVSKGWQLALQQMKVGSKWQGFIPSNLAYGQNGSPPRIPPNSVLVFDIELLGIQ